MHQNTFPKTLTIAGSDCSGGAGIQADLKTFSALGCYGMSVIVALTAQNTQEVSDIHAPPASFTKAQLDAVFKDVGADAVKIGMLFNKSIINTVCNALEEYKPKHIILDPVMVSQSGAKLLQDDAIDLLRERLVPLSTIITPNIHEAAVLLNRNSLPDDKPEMICRELSHLKSRAVLLKGGHSNEEKATDYLHIRAKDKMYQYVDARIETSNLHGTGCTLSSAIAAYLAREYNLTDAVREAKSYISGAIKAGSYYEIGKGSGPVHHFFRIW